MSHINYTPFEKLKICKPVYRIPWILRQAQDKTVLDLGAFDETALNKVETPHWLHGRLAQVASQVIGIDNSDQLQKEELQTSNKSKILKRHITDLEEITYNESFDLIVAGELIEHLPHALEFLDKIKQLKNMSGKQFVLTTPNATSFHNAALALFKRESSHKDHLQIYSYKTLNTLCERTGFQSWEIIPYHVQFSELLLKKKGVHRRLITFCEKSVNAFEWLFPMISGGWIVNIRI